MEGEPVESTKPVTMPPESEPTTPPPVVNEPDDEAAEDSPEVENHADAVRKLFPELKEQGEKGKSVVEAMVLLLEHGTLTIEDFKHLIYNGVHLDTENLDLDEEYQADKTGTHKDKYIASSLEGRLRLFPLFFEKTPEEQARILAHEMGHMMDLRPVIRGEGKDAKAEVLIDSKEYAAKFGSRPSSWHGMYVEKFFRDFPDHAAHEMLAEDMADYLRAHSPEEWVVNRLKRMNSQEQSKLQPLVTAGEWTDPELSSLLDHAGQVMDYFNQALGSKKGYIKARGKALDDSDDLFSSYYGGGGGGGSSTYNSNVDLSLLSKFYDMIFGAK